MMHCERCGKEYREFLDTIVQMDYAETGRGKPCIFHLCVDCRKALLQWVEEQSESITL